MRIAVSGSHRTGKSTLAEALASRNPDHTLVPEPYEFLVSEGYAFNHPPSLEDFEVQFERSLEFLDQGDPKAIFDRCPLDFIAYLSTHADTDLFTTKGWLPHLRRTMGSLDLVVFTPIEVEDRIVLTASDIEDRLRSKVDEKLRELLIEDVLDLGAEVLKVSGSARTRADAVSRRLQALEDL